MEVYKVAVVGGSDTVIGFKALGLDAYGVGSREEAAELFKRISARDSGYAVIYVEEGFAEGLGEAMDKFKGDPGLAVILIPGRDGSTGLGRKALKDAVERAVGSDIAGD